jgi:uncharacterized membrane protein YdbT with pleckstrin-like domain
MNEQHITIKPTIVYALLRSLGQFFIMGVIVAVSMYFEVMSGLLVLIIPSMIILYRILYWKLVSYEISPQQIKYTRGILHRRSRFSGNVQGQGF